MPTKAKVVVTIAILAILTLSIVSSSILTDKDIKQSWWKYGGGYHIGDRLDFNKHKLTNDTIFLENHPVALLIKKEGNSLGINGTKIEIKSLTSEETGTYHQK